MRPACPDDAPPVLGRCAPGALPRPGNHADANGQ
jgi:hypothetical protein